MPKPTSRSTEVLPRAENDRRQRRSWSKDEKLRILREADACSKRGEVGALLRREGLYSSHLTDWRHQLKTHGEEGLAPKKAGRKAKKTSEGRHIEKLERKTARLEHELKVARAVIELQKKAHEVLGLALPKAADDERF